MSAAMKPSTRSLLLRALLFVYFASRLSGLTLLPVFVDEGGHLRIAAEVSHGRAMLQPMVEGKPLQIWLSALLVPWAPDLLWASRFLSVLAGAAAVWACFEIGRRLYSEAVGWAAAGLYVVCPFTLFYDRLAAPDGILAAFAALTILATIVVLQAPTRRHGLYLGLAMSAAVLAKVPGLLLLPAPVLAAWLFGKFRDLPLRRCLAGAYALTFAICIVPLAFFFLRTEEVQGKTHLGANQLHLREMLAQNLHLAGEWLSVYWTVPVLAIGLLGICWSVAKKDTVGIWLGALALVPIAVFCAACRCWFPRYLVFATAPFLVVTAATLWALTRETASELRGRAVPFLFSLLLLVMPGLRTDFRLWTEPATAGLPKADQIGYVEGWSAGYGIPEAVQFFRRELARHPEGMILATFENEHEEIARGLWVNLKAQPRLELHKLNLANAHAPEQLAAWAEEKPTYVVVNHSAGGWAKADQQPLQQILGGAGPIQSFAKPGGKNAVEIYRLATPGPQAHALR